MKLLFVVMVNMPASMAPSALMKLERIAPVTVKLVSLVLINLPGSIVSINRQQSVPLMKKIQLVATVLPFVSMMENARAMLPRPARDTLDVPAQMNGLGEYESEIPAIILSIFANFFINLISEHCEFLKSEYSALNASQNTSSSNGRSGAQKFGIFMLVTGSFLLVVGGVFFYLRIKERNAAMNNMPGPDDNIAPSSGVSVFGTNPSSSGIVLDLGPNKDLDGNVLHNVDII